MLQDSCEKRALEPHITVDSNVMRSIQSLCIAVALVGPRAK